MTKAWRRMGMAAAVATLAGLLAGCWDQYPLAQRASALVLYVSSAPKNQMSWTFYFPNPTVTTGSLANISGSQQFFKLTTTASSLLQAEDDIETKMARRMYMGQLETIIFSSRVSTDQMAAVIEGYNRVGNWPKDAYVLAEKPNPQPLPILPEQPVPDVYFASYFRCKSCNPADLSQPAWRVWDDLETPGVSPVLPYGTNPLNPNRLMVYRQFGRAYAMSRRQTLGWSQLMNRTSRLTISLKSPQGDYAAHNVKVRTKERIQMIHGRLQVAVRVRVVGNLAEWPESVDVTPATEALPSYDPRACPAGTPVTPVG